MCSGCVSESVCSEQAFAGVALGAPLDEALPPGLEFETNSGRAAAGHVLLELVLAPGLRHGMLLGEPQCQQAALSAVSQNLY